MQLLQLPQIHRHWMQDIVRLLSITQSGVLVLTAKVKLETWYVQNVLQGKFMIFEIAKKSFNQIKTKKTKFRSCSNKDTRFHRFQDGSLRLLGRENECLKRGSSRDMVYGSCSGAYTFNPKYIAGSPNPKTYKIVSFYRHFTGATDKLES